MSVWLPLMYSSWEVSKCCCWRCNFIPTKLEHFLSHNYNWKVIITFQQTFFQVWSYYNFLLSLEPASLDVTVMISSVGLVMARCEPNDDDVWSNNFFYIREMSVGLDRKWGIMMWASDPVPQSSNQGPVPGSSRPTLVYFSSSIIQIKIFQILIFPGSIKSNEKLPKLFYNQFKMSDLFKMRFWW